MFTKRPLPKSTHWRRALSSLVLAVALLVCVGGQAAYANCACGSVDPNAPCQGNSASYTRQSETIRFTFDCDGGACACGRFANEHDFWVAPNSPGETVTITRMEPDANPTGGVTGGLINGAMDDILTMESNQGFNGQIHYSSSRTVFPPYAVDPESVGRPVVLLKSISNPNADPSNRKCNTERMCLLYVETLTVLPGVPTEPVFRPPYFGTEKPLIPLRDFDASILPELQTTAGATSWAEALEVVTSVNLSFISNWNVRERFHPKINTGNASGGYPGKVAVKFNPALMKLVDQATTARDRADKVLLAKRIAQVGIDLYYISKNGGGDFGGVSAEGICGAWVSNGGYGLGKLAPILIASSLLGREDEWNARLNQVLSTPEGRQCFGETGTIQPPNSAGKNVALFGALSNDLYRVSSSNKSEADAQGLRDASGNDASECVASYQACCTTGPMLGSAMPIFLIPQVAQSFPENAAHWLEYVDRSRETGVEVGEEFGAYCSASSFAIRGYSSGYDNAVSYSLYDAYRACSRDFSCPGMNETPAPPTQRPNPPTNVIVE